MTDPIADLLTRLRNAGMAHQDACLVPFSRLKHSICDILAREGFLAAVEEAQDEKGHPALRVTLKYVDGRSAIRGVRRISKPGRRLYCAVDDVPRVLTGLGIAILTTSRGVMKDADARRERVGGEPLCAVW